MLPRLALPLALMVVTPLSGPDNTAAVAPRLPTLALPTVLIFPLDRLPVTETTPLNTPAPAPRLPRLALPVTLRIPLTLLMLPAEMLPVNTA